MSTSHCSSNNAGARLPQSASMIGIPNELLCEVFQLVCSTPSPDENPRWHAALPITLSHVSYRWREVICGLPHLWTEVHISGYDPDVLEALFTRSKGRPLSIYLDFPNPAPKGATLRLWKTLIAVLGCMPRCRHLTVSTFEANYKLIRNIFTDHCDAPLLESLALTCLTTTTKTTTSSSSEPALFPSIHYDPAVLTRLYVDNVVLPGSSPASGVRDLEVRNAVGPWGWDAGWAAEDAFESTALRRLALTNARVPRSTAIRAPGLEHLVLRGGDPAAALAAGVGTGAEAGAGAGLRSVEVAGVDGEEWEAVVRCVVRDGQAQLGVFATVECLTLAQLDGGLLFSGLDVDFFNAFSGLKCLKLVGVGSVEPLFRFLRDNPAIWAGAVVLVDDERVPFRDS